MLEETQVMSERDLPSRGVVNDRLHFANSLFVDLFTEGARFHVARLLQDVHGPITWVEHVTGVAH